MRFYPFILFLLLCSCKTGKLKVIADIPSYLKEVSAVETLPGSNLMWVIEDSGNKPKVYAINTEGSVSKTLTIKNSKNKDWEDLTSDATGNMYIGDFGNNSKNRKKFTIYKISNILSPEANITTESITFKLPESIKSHDFEAFFLLKNTFYIFSKNNNEGIVISVPNTFGKHTASFVTAFNLKGDHNKITSADISDDGKTIVLLNHDKVWKLTNFDGDNFFEGTIESLTFEHDSQKEGVCFKDNNTIYITDEYNGIHGGNVYEFLLH
jgi:hypothetical protein